MSRPVNDNERGRREAAVTLREEEKPREKPKRPEGALAVRRAHGVSTMCLLSIHNCDLPGYFRIPACATAPGFETRRAQRVGGEGGGELEPESTEGRKPKKRESENI